MKKATLFSISFWVYAALTAQTTFNNQFNFPEFPFQVLTSVLPTDSCYYATGIITDTSNQSYTVGNIFIKFDLMGEVEFYKKLSDPEKFYETWRGDLIADGQGHLFDVGYQTDSVRSAFLVQYNTQGDTVFTNSYLNPFFPADDFIVTAALKKKENGNMYLLCGIDNNPDAANPDICLMEIDKDGALLNSYVYGNSNVNETPYSLLVDDDGGAVIGANQTNRGFVSNGFYSKTYIFKVNASGQIQWEYISNSPQLFDIARDMVKTTDGGLVIATGKGKEYPTNPSSSQLRWNAYLLKLNADHQKEWGTEIRGLRQSPESSFIKVVPAADGSGYVCTGRIDEGVSIGEQAIGSWVVKISTEGDSLWTRYYSFFDSIAVEPRPKDLKTTPDGGYVVVGETKPRLPDGQAQRAWIMKLDEHGCLIPGCEENDTTLSPVDLHLGTHIQLAIFPNPTSDYLNFQLRTQQVDKSATFRIVDANGKIMQEIESKMPKETHIVPVWDWAAGVYFLQYMENGSVRHSERFVVLKK